MTPLLVRCGDHHFAPRHEAVSIEYEVPRGFAVRELWIEVLDRTEARVLRERVLELGPGPSAAWDGHLAADAWAHPLGSPFTVSLSAELDALVEDEHFSATEPRSSVVVGCRREDRRDDLVREDVEPEVAPFAERATLEVLHHSVELLRCPWEEAYLGDGWDDDQRLVAALNQRGYYAGVPAEASRDDGSPLMRALRRFQFNHPTQQVAAFDANALAELVDDAPALFDVLVDGGVAVAPGALIPDRPLRLHVEAIGFEADFVNARETEFEHQYQDYGDRHRWHHEAQRLNRPLLPILAKIYLRTKSDAGVHVPEAVGPVEVLWTIEEPDHDASEALDDWGQRSQPRTFLQQLYAEVKGTTGSHNAPVTHGGIRTADHPWRAPFRAGTAITGFDLVSDDGRSGMANVASVDRARPSVLGTSCVYFHPSWIGGDRYRVTASLVYDEPEHAEHNGVLSCRTGVIEIWRRVRLGAIVGWPPRAGGYAGVIQHMKTHFGRAFVDIDDAGVALVRASEVLTDDDFRQILARVLALTGHGRELLESVVSSDLTDDGLFALRPEADWSVSDEQLDRRTKGATVERRALELLDQALDLGAPLTLTEQFALESLRQFTDRLLSMIQLVAREEPIPALISGRIRARLGEREHYRPGIVLLDYKLMDRPYRAMVKLMGEVTTLSEGNHDLFALVDQRYLDGEGYVLTHEIGHTFMLRHHENAGREETVADQQRDHDTDDHGCLMSYVKAAPSPRWPHQVPGRYRAAFCGKCLLKLRGWNVHAGGRLARPAKTLHIAGLYDHADAQLRGDVELGMLAQQTKALTDVEVTASAFDRDASIDAWARIVDGSDVYHHVSHGNQYCTKHARRAASLWHFEPKYMLACVSGPRAQELKDSEANAHADVLAEAPDRQRREAATFYAAHYNLASGFFSYDHALEGVFQWVMDPLDSSRDLMFHPADLEARLRGMGHRPQLAFISCCLTGWNGALPRAFIRGGVGHVIAFRGRYNPGGQLAFPTLFYETWVRFGLTWDTIDPAFRLAATRYPNAEPTLFTANGWIRTVCPNGDAAVRREIQARERRPPLDHEILLGLRADFVEGALEDALKLESAFFRTCFSSL